MSNYTPGGLSFAALTVLVEHAENANDCPIIVAGPRQQTVLSLIEKGMLRQKNSRLTTITRHGRDHLHRALGLWADLLSRYETASIEEAVKRNAQEARTAKMACGQRNSQADSVDTTVPA